MFYFSHQHHHHHHGREQIYMGRHVFFVCFIYNNFTNELEYMFTRYLHFILSFVIIFLLTLSTFMSSPYFMPHCVAAIYMISWLMHTNFACLFLYCLTSFFVVVVLYYYESANKHDNFLINHLFDNRHDT